MKFKDFLKEESPVLGLSHKREFEKLGKKHKNHLKHIDIFPKGQNTIYIPIAGTYKAKMNKDLRSRLINSIASFRNDLRLGRFYIKDSSGNTVPYINRYDLDVKFKINNVSGLVKAIIKYTDKNKPIKLIKDFKVEDIIERYVGGNTGDFNNTKKLYKNMYKYSAFRKGPTFDNLAIAITRDPCHVGGMSTNVGWKSCMNLYTGAFNKSTRDDIKHGTLAAYLIDAKDKNIEYPIGRVLIKGYLEIGGGKQKLLNVGKANYGEMPDFAKAEIQKWVDNIQKNIKGHFKFNPDLYQDWEDSFITKGIKPEVFSVGTRVRVIDTSGDNEDSQRQFKNKIGRIRNYDRQDKTYNLTFDLDHYDDLHYDDEHAYGFHPAQLKRV